MTVTMIIAATKDNNLDGVINICCSTKVTFLEKTHIRLRFRPILAQKWGYIGGLPL